MLNRTDFSVISDIFFSIVRNCLVALLVIVVPASLIAQEYPRTNGVFVFDTEHGEWIQIPPFQFRDFSVGSSVNSPRESWSRFPLFNGWYSIPAASFDNYWSTPFVAGDDSSIRIYIRSRSPEIDFVTYLTGFDEFVSTIPPGRAVQTLGNVNGGDFDSRSGVPGLIDSNSGWSANRLQAMIVDDYSSEYLMQDIGSPVVQGIGDCNSCNSPVYGFVIRSGSERFVFRTTNFQLVYAD